jgi:hypothetical protein
VGGHEFPDVIDRLLGIASDMFDVIFKGQMLVKVDAQDADYV